MGKFPFYAAVAVILTYVGATTADVRASSNDDVRASNVAAAARTEDLRGAPAVGSYEAGLQAAYSFALGSNAQMVTFFPRVSRVMTVLDGSAPGVVTFGVEGMFSRIFEPSHAMELGGGLLLRYRLAYPHVQPYAELEGGMLYSDLRHFDLGSRVLFTAQAAVGLQVPLGGGFAATAGYRFRHISNAGQSRSNPGLNSNLLIAGLTYAF